MFKITSKQTKILINARPEINLTKAYNSNEKWEDKMPRDVGTQL